MADETLSFKQMCAKFDVTPRTLRYYEYIELLQPARDGRTRAYGTREVARIVLILRGRRFGFSLEEIRQWLLLREQQGNRAQTQVWLEAADRQIAALENQSQDITDAIRDLKTLRAESAAALE